MKQLLFSVLFLVGIGVNGQTTVSQIKITSLVNRINLTSDTSLIINFWATWCAPCVKELPAFDTIFNKYHQEKVKIILVSLDFKKDIESKLIPFIEKKEIKPPVIFLDETQDNYFIPKISDKWSGAIPATLIVNSKNSYRYFHEGELDVNFLEDQIKKATK